jgi:alpha-1,3-rhamnosyl/mannosyltransferase
MWVGRPYGRKNLDTLFRAYAILRRCLADAPPLRIVGVEPEHRLGLEELLKTAGVTDGVSLEPPAMHTRLPELLHTAKVFVDPSRYESFGLPVLEAMAAGTPVVCADIPAYRELHAGRALFADPDAPDRFAAEIARLLTDTALWNRMSHDGVHHAARFTWGSCVRNTYEIYRRLLGTAREPAVSGGGGLDRKSTANRQPAAA